MFAHGEFLVNTSFSSNLSPNSCGGQKHLPIFPAPHACRYQVKFYRNLFPEYLLENALKFARLFGSRMQLNLFAALFGFIFRIAKHNAFNG